LAAAYFHAGASRSLGRRLALTQDRPPFCPGYRHPVDYTASICPTRSQGEILFLVSSSRLLLTPSVAPTDDHQSGADGVPFLSMMIYSFLDSIVFLASRVPHLSHDMLPPLADYNYIKNLVQRSFTSCVYFSSMQPLLTHSVSTCISFPVATGGIFSALIYLSYVPRQNSIFFRLTHTQAGNTSKCRFLSSSESYCGFSRQLE